MSAQNDNDIVTVSNNKSGDTNSPSPQLGEAGAAKPSKKRSLIKTIIFLVIAFVVIILIYNSCTPKSISINPNTVRYTDGYIVISARNGKGNPDANLKLKGDPAKMDDFYDSTYAEAYFSFEQQTS
jgi:hypothetical protein